MKESAKNTVMFLHLFWLISWRIFAVLTPISWLRKVNLWCKIGGLPDFDSFRLASLSAEVEFQPLFSHKESWGSDDKVLYTKNYVIKITLSTVSCQEQLVDYKSMHGEVIRIKAFESWIKLPYFWETQGSFPDITTIFTRISAALK